jgi:hypothetical protein
MDINKNMISFGLIHMAQDKIDFEKIVKSNKEITFFL